MSFHPEVGDKVWFSALRSHVCGGHIMQCECHYPIGQKGPRGYPGNLVSRPATVIEANADGTLELDVDLTDEDVEIYGLARRQTRVLRSMPASGTWTFRNTYRKRMDDQA